MAIQSLDKKVLNEGRPCDRIPAKSQKVFQPDLITFFGGKKLRLSDSHHFVSQGPQGIESQGLVTCCIGHNIGIFPVGLRNIIIQNIKKDAHNESAGGDRSTGMA
jgi:hypothetical protein